MTNWYGMFVPTGTPRDVVHKLNAEVVRILKQPEATAKLADSGMTVVANSPEQFAEFVDRESAKYIRIIDTAGIKGSL